MGTNEDWEILMRKYKGKRITRGRAIKLYCKLECCAGDYESWKNCPITNCFLWKFRLGKETLAKPKSFKNKRKTISFSSKNNASDTDINPIQTTLKMEARK